MPSTLPKARMRVTFVSHTEDLYGANRSLMVLLRRAEEFGVQPSVIAREEGPFTEQLERLNVPYVVYPLKRWMSKARWKAPARLVMNLAIMPFLLSKVREWGTDVIHTNSSVIPTGAILAECAGLPHVWHVREFGDLDYDLAHDWGEGGFRFGVNRADALIAVSNSIRRHVLAELRPPTRVIYNGVISRERLTAFKPDADTEDPSGSDEFVFAIIGRIQPKKGQEQAIAALSRLRESGVDARLLVAGNGREDYERRVRAMCREREVKDSVEFLGFVSCPFEVHRRSDAVLMCSLHEAMGRVTAEAMAAARPVIGFNQDGTAELIDDEENGLLYDGTVGDLAAAMRRLVDNTSLARSLGQAGWEKAEEMFTEETYAEQVFDVQRRVCSS